MGSPEPMPLANLSPRKKGVAVRLLKEEIGFSRCCCHWIHPLLLPPDPPSSPFSSAPSTDLPLPIGMAGTASFVPVLLQLAAEYAEWPPTEHCMCCQQPFGTLRSSFCHLNALHATAQSRERTIRELKSKKAKMQKKTQSLCFTIMLIGTVQKICLFCRIQCLFVDLTVEECAKSKLWHLHGDLGKTLD